jgi:hypothetical protein
MWLRALPLCVNSAGSPFSISVATPGYQTLVVAPILSELDYCSAMLIGLPSYQRDRLQSVLNAALWSVAGLRLSDHIAGVLAGVHWLRVPAGSLYISCPELLGARPTVVFAAPSCGHFVTSTIAIWPA